MEFIRLIEHLSNSIDFNKRGASTLSEATAEIRNLVIKRDISFLPKHSERRHKHVFGTLMLLLIDGNDAITEVEPALRLFLITNGKHGSRTAKGCDVARRLARFAIGDDTGNAQSARGINR